MTYLEMQENEANKTRDTARDIFVASLRDYAADSGWEWVLCGSSKIYAGDTIRTPMMGDIQEFSRLYGWPDTLTAIAAAMRADEQFKREAEGRR